MSVLPPDLELQREALARSYDLATESVQVADRSFTLLTVRDTNRLLDAIDPQAFAADERLPYWAEIWTSALALAAWCVRAPEVPGARLLELGCGLGLAGIAAASAGAEVTMTDYEEDALRFARLNAAWNLPSPPAGSSPECRLLDWRTPEIQEEQYNLIIGADITYERRMFSPLLTLCARALAPGGMVVLTEPDRTIGRDFRQQAEEAGFRMNAIHEAVTRNGRETLVVHAELRKGRSS